MTRSHIIFDFDRTIGTLLVDWSDWRRRVANAIRQVDPESDVRPEDVRHAKQNWFIEQYGPGFRDLLNVINAQCEAKYVSDFVPNARAVDFIRISEAKLFLWSSNSLSTVEKYLTALGIYGRFNRVITREDTYYLKPDAEGFALLREAHVPLSDYILVGDSDADAGAAKAANILFVCVSDDDWPAIVGW